MTEGEALLRDIAAFVPARGRCGLWWLGQMGFALRIGGALLYLDPYLSESPKRKVAPLLAPRDLAGADLVLGSHDHGDHIDRPAWPAVAAAAPHARFVVPDLLLPGLASDLGIPLRRFLGLDDGKSARRGRLEVSALPAAHEFLDRDPVTGRHPHLGYVIRGGGCTVYHAGDTCLYEGIQERLRGLRPDVMILPINGRDAKRLSSGCIGNMTYQEAADLAGSVAPRLVIPGHFEMFAHNGEDPALFADYMRVKYPAVAVRVPVHGERIEVRCA